MNSETLIIVLVAVIAGIAILEPAISNTGSTFANSAGGDIGTGVGIGAAALGVGAAILLLL